MPELVHAAAGPHPINPAKKEAGPVRDPLAHKRGEPESPAVLHKGATGAIQGSHSQQVNGVEITWCMTLRHTNLASHEHALHTPSPMVIVSLLT